MQNINELEVLVIKKFLEDESVSFEQSDLDGLKIENRDYTGVGFFTDFFKPLSFNFDAKLANPRGKVSAELNGNILTGYIFYVDGQMLKGIEGFTYGDDEWPKKITSIEILK